MLAYDGAAANATTNYTTDDFTAPGGNRTFFGSSDSTRVGGDQWALLNVLAVDAAKDNVLAEGLVALPHPTYLQRCLEYLYEEGGAKLSPNAQWDWPPSS